MKTILLFTLTLSLSLAALAQAPETPTGKTARIDPAPEKGFSYPYYLFTPASPESGNTQTLLVIPNNTGKTSDDLNDHEANVKGKMAQAAFIFGRLGTPVLVPVFPRPQKEWKIYTHALDRDTLTTDLKEYSRLDLQLAAMIRDARTRLASTGSTVGEKVLMYGFSASAMFANRFAFLHPDLVKAAAVGSPGGWPIAPAGKFKGTELRYPLGIADLKSLTGHKTDRKELAKVAFFFFLGGEDDNDSLVFRDGYEEDDEKLAMELLGKSPVERWPVAESIYKDAGMNAVFKLYPGEGHRPSKEMVEDVLSFLEKNKY